MRAIASRRLADELREGLVGGIVGPQRPPLRCTGAVCYSYLPVAYSPRRPVTNAEQLPFLVASYPFWPTFKVSWENNRSR